MTKKIKMTEVEANQMMGFAMIDGHITCWNISKAGYVRYHDAVARVWRDLIQYDFTRWHYAL